MRKLLAIGYTSLALMVGCQEKKPESRNLESWAAHSYSEGTCNFVDEKGSTNQMRVTYYEFQGSKSRKCELRANADWGMMLFSQRGEDVLFMGETGFRTNNSLQYAIIEPYEGERIALTGKNIKQRGEDYELRAMRDIEELYGVLRGELQKMDEEKMKEMLKISNEEREMRRKTFDKIPKFQQRLENQ